MYLIEITTLILVFIYIVGKMLYREGVISFWEITKGSNDTIFSSKLSFFPEFIKVELLNGAYRESIYQVEMKFFADSGNKKLFINESIDKGRTLAFFKGDEILTVETLDPLLTKLKIPKLVFKSQMESICPEQCFKAIFLLHYHLNRILSSEYSAELINLPPKIIDLKTALPEEIINKTDDIMSNSLRGMRILLEKGFDDYQHEIRKKISKRVRRKLFGFKKLDFPSFVYLFNIANTHFSHFAVNTTSTTMQYGLFPVINHLPPASSSFKDAEPFSLTRLGRGDMFGLLAEKDFLKSDEITRVLASNNMYQLMFFGKSSTFLHPYECEPIDDHNISYSLRDFLGLDAIKYVVQRSSQVAKESLRCFEAGDTIKFYNHIHYDELEKEQQSACLGDILLCKDCQKKPKPFYKFKSCGKASTAIMAKRWTPLSEYFAKRIKYYEKTLNNLQNVPIKLKGDSEEAFAELKKFYVNKIKFNKVISNEMTLLYEEWNKAR